MIKMTTATISERKKRQLYELIKKKLDKDEILKILKDRGGKEKTLTIYYLSSLRSYSAFSMVVEELEREGKLQKTGDYGEYLQVIE